VTKSYNLSKQIYILQKSGKSLGMNAYLWKL